MYGRLRSLQYLFALIMQVSTAVKNEVKIARMYVSQITDGYESVII